MPEAPAMGSSGPDGGACGVLKSKNSAAIQNVMVLVQHFKEPDATQAATNQKPEKSMGMVTYRYLALYFS
ncbi:MAG: hypothetical protein KKB05_02240 [Proteobacteria bacterium]|nr:hypothetical protein [Pseudomonadota bacterium]